ncbi:MAG: hypothetical protein JXA97_03660 [Anaerolineales bacterium]|nr:hypothetical protein [Anaerolineales bacterium]
MHDRRDQNGVVGPLILIGAGGLLLASRMGVAVDFIAILRMWPLLLIAVGIDLLIGRRSMYGALAAAVIVIAMFAGAFWLFGVTDVASLETQSFHVEMGEYEALELSLDPAVGRVTIDPMQVESDNAITAVVSTVLGENVDTRVVEHSDSQSVSIRADGMWTGRNVGQWDSQPGWMLELNPALAYTIEVDMGVGQLDLDFTGMVIDELRIDMGIGQTILRLPEGAYRTVVDAAIGDLLVYVPRGESISIVADTGIASRSLPMDFIRNGDRYISPNFDIEAAGIELFLGQAIGSLRVIYLL